MFKPAGALSGGERVKLSLGLLLVNPCNALLLDEPTNYLDLPSIEAIQALLQAYEGTLLFVSHDEAFSRAVADATLHIDAGKVLWNPKAVPEKPAQGLEESERVMLEHRKALLISQFGQPGAEPDALLAALKEINARLADER